MPLFNIGFVIFPDLTLLDFTGPLQVLSRVPQTATHIVAKSAAPVPSDCGVGLVPTHTFANCPPLDLICVPGGNLGVVDAFCDRDTIEFVRRQARTAKYVTSVCTGAIILGVAGLLKGRRATTHWAFVDLLPLVGATHEKARVVQDGNVITAAGVSSGIDFAFTAAAEIAGETAARSNTARHRIRPGAALQFRQSRQGIACHKVGSDRPGLRQVPVGVPRRPREGRPALIELFGVCGDLSASMASGTGLAPGIPRGAGSGQRAEIVRHEPRAWAACLTARLAARPAWRSARWHWASALRWGSRRRARPHARARRDEVAGCGGDGPAADRARGPPLRQRRAQHQPALRLCLSRHRRHAPLPARPTKAGWRPTLRMKPGETLKIRLINDLPPNRDLRPSNPSHPHQFNNTNFHFHGAHCSPSGIADNVMRSMVPGKSYDIEITLARGPHARHLLVPSASPRLGRRAGGERHGGRHHRRRRLRRCARDRPGARARHAAVARSCSTPSTWSRTSARSFRKPRRASWRSTASGGRPSTCGRGRCSAGAWSARSTRTTCCWSSTSTG